MKTSREIANFLPLAREFISLRYFGRDEHGTWGNIRIFMSQGVSSGKCLIFKLWASDPISVRLRLLISKNDCNTGPIIYLTGLW